MAEERLSPPRLRAEAIGYYRRVTNKIIQADRRRALQEEDPSPLPNKISSEVTTSLQTEKPTLKPTR